MAVRIAAGEDRCMGHPCVGSVCDGLLKKNPLRGEGIEVRGFCALISITAETIGPHAIKGKEDKVVG